MSDGQKPSQTGIPGRLLASKQVQALLFALTVLYCVSPVDVIPDVLPIIGWMDDLGVLLTDIVAFMYYLRSKRQEHEAKTEGTPRP